MTGLIVVTCDAAGCVARATVELRWDDQYAGKYCRPHGQRRLEQITRSTGTVLEWAHDIDREYDRTVMEPAARLIAAIRRHDR